MVRWLLVSLLCLAPALAHAGPDTLAILYFHNQGNPELEPLKVGLSQMLISDLEGADGVAVVERAQLQSILDELELGHSGMVDPDTAAQVGKLLGARWMLLGSYFELMGTLRIDARLVRVETGEIVHAHGVDGSAQVFMSLEKALAGSFREALATQTTESAQPAGPTGFADVSEPAAEADAMADATTRGGSTPDVVYPDAKELEAAVNFSEGLIYLDRSDLPRAREAFQQALASNPALTVAQEALAGLEI